MECGSYRGIKLLEHAMKVVERIFEHRIRQQIKIDDMQFGFMKGKGIRGFFINDMRYINPRFTLLYFTLREPLMPFFYGKTDAGDF